jgi:hypothetical protein
MGAVSPFAPPRNATAILGVDDSNDRAPAWSLKDSPA